MTTLSTYPFDLLWNFDAPSQHSTISTKAYNQTVTSDAYKIEVPMVGITKSDLHIHVDDNKLIASAKPANKNRFVTDHNYSWYLNDDVDVSNIGATLENGLLTISVARIKPVKRTVNVHVN